MALVTGQFKDALNGKVPPRLTGSGGHHCTNGGDQKPPGVVLAVHEFLVGMPNLPFPDATSADEHFEFPGFELAN